MYNIINKLLYKEVIDMLAANYTEARNNFKKYCDEVTDNYEQVIITRKGNKNVVLLSLDEYNNMRENLFVLGNPKNAAALLESIEQIKRGKVVKKTWEELKAMEND